MPASKSAVSSRKTKELEAAARKAKAVTPPLVLKERQSKSAADVDAGVAPPKQRGTFQKRGVLPAKKLSSKRTRPTTAGLTLARKLSAEAKADAIVAEVRAEVDARMAEESVVPAGGANVEVIGHASGGDFIYDLHPGDLEKEFYAQMAQADLALEAFDAGLTMEQLMSSKEDEERANSEAAAVATKSKSEQAMAGTPTTPSGAARAPAGGVKRSSSGVSAPSSKRRRAPPVILGTRDG